MCKISADCEEREKWTDKAYKKDGENCALLPMDADGIICREEGDKRCLLYLPEREKTCIL